MFVKHPGMLIQSMKDAVIDKIGKLWHKILNISIFDSCSKPDPVMLET